MWQQIPETERVAATGGRTKGSDYLPLPMNPGDAPWMIEGIKDNVQHYYVVRWPKMVLFDSGERKSSIWFSVGRFGSDEVALKAAWRYFSDRFRGVYAPESEVDAEGNQVSTRNQRGGPFSETNADGVVFHGDGSHRFTRWTSFGKPIGGKFKIVCWQKHSDTLEEPARFCSNHEFVARDAQGNEIYECKGHDYWAMWEAKLTPQEFSRLGGAKGLGELGGGDGEVLPPEAQLDDSALEDCWDYFTVEKKFARIHEVPRQFLCFGQELVQARDDDGGPGLEVVLSKRRITAVHFLDGGFELHDSNDYEQEGGATTFTEPETGELRYWTGQSLFWPEGVEPLPECLARGTYQPRTRAEVVDALEGKIDHEAIEPNWLSVAGLEREFFIAAQRACKDCGLLYIAVQARDNNRSLGADLNKSKTIAPELWINGQKPASVERQSLNYEITSVGVLCRRVYDSVDGELQLRPCVPTGAAQKIEVPGIGEKSLSLRDRLLLEYHNGKIGGHLGRDKTFQRVERDWWWPGLYTCVVDWCRHCVACQQENSRTGVSAWSRTEFYDRPFRVLQFDIVQCAEHGGEGGIVTGARYILTVICCFSRWPWLIPLVEKSAENVAKGLLEKVIIGIAMFPTVLRSDNAKEFVSDLIRYMNRLLGINHITGSFYHPQSQGLVENMHRTMSQVLRMLINNNPKEWEAMLPYCECILRSTPLNSLGGRSPYQVVTGLRPRLPRLV